jgi:hypothetical protein
MNIEKLISALPDKNSSDQYWMNWHNDLRKNFGQKKANEAFVVAFAYNASSSAKTKDLFRYGQSQGLNLETNLLGDAGRIIEGVQDSISGITGKIGNMFKTGKTVITLIIILILVPVFMLLFNLAKQPEKALGAIADGISPVKGIKKV